MSLPRQLSALRGRSLAELVWRARAGGHRWLEGRGLGLAGLTEGRLLAHLPGDLREDLRRRWAAPWLSITPSVERTSLAIPQGEKDRLRKIADDACAGRFRLLGYDFLDFGRPVNWHLDPVRERSAAMRHWSRIPFLDPDQVGDHKIIWELNRHQFLATLGQAYALTGDELYAQTAVAYLKQWIAANPPSLGINWSSSLEVGLRAIAWLWSLRYLVHSDSLSPDAFDAITATLVRHGLHVERYLSRYFSPNTHLTGEALALLYLGTLLPKTRTTERWMRTGLAILEQELPRQVWDDGVYFEKSTWYQRYTVDFYLHATVLRNIGGTPAPEWWTTRVSAASKVLAALARPDGTIPLIGDDDGGCLLNLESTDVTDVRPTLALAASVLGVPIPSSVNPASPIATWMLGPTTTPPNHAMAVEALTAFPDGGLHVFRDHQPQSTMLVVDAGSMGRYGHAHAGCLGFDVTIGSTPVIADPGTFSYVGPDRTTFRSGAAHSSITLAGEGSAITDGLFGWRGRPAVEVRACETAPKGTRLSAVQQGWTESACGEAIHERTVIWLREGWLVCDRISDKAARPIGIALQAGNEITIALTSNDEAVFRTASGETLYLAVTASTPATLTLQQGAVAPCYGRRHSAPRLEVAVTPTSAERDTILVLAFSRQPVSVRQDVTAAFSSGTEVQVGFRDGRLEWS